MLAETSLTAALHSSLSRPTATLSPHALTVLSKRWLRKGETPEEMFRRVAVHVASAEETTQNAQYYADRFYSLMASLRFLPNSPTFTGAGTRLNQLAACYVIPVPDNMEGIFDAVRTAALIHKTGGGTGFSFSALRPKNAPVKSSGGKASGPVSFMRVFDAACGAIAQGGTRRGANMGVLLCSHPDIFDFIRCKSQEGQIENFNISVAVTDDFLRRVERDQDFDLVFEGTVYQTIRARDLWNEIIAAAHSNGEPGVLFIDEANRTNPLPHLYVLVACNPCSEQWLGDNENCCLGSINLLQHVFKNTQGKWEIDYSKLEDTICTAVRFLDNVVTVNGYVPAVPQLKEAAHQGRRIGLGIMGLWDTLVKLNLGYNTEQGRDFAQGVMAFIQYFAMSYSVELAQERGPFPAIKGSIFDPEAFRWPIPDDKHELPWKVLVRDIKRFGIRNCAVTTIAPTGTLSTVAGLEGYGCEPAFALAYTRNLREGDGSIPLEYVSPLFEEAVRRQYHTHMLDADENDAATAQAIQDVMDAGGSCQNIMYLHDSIRSLFVTAGDIAPEDHVLMQAALQKYTCNSISKTCNLPASATQEDVSNIYMLAWKTGCKGITVYRQGSRTQVVLEVKPKTEECPEGCGPLVEQEGCYSCPTCGMSKCSV